MDFLEFPKFFKELSAEKLGETLKDIGFDGVDVMVRNGYWVTYDNLSESLSEYIKIMQSFGLSTKSATTSLTNVDDPDFENMYSIFADNGVEMYRYGGFGYRGMGTFHEDFARARKVLEKLEKLGEKYRIKAVLQMHGGTLHYSSSSSYFLLNGFNPEYIGSHIDPGNMVHQEGHETWEKSVDIIKPYLCYVGVKSAAAFLLPHHETYKLHWRKLWVPLADGIIDWKNVIQSLRKAQYDGPLCFHNFYEHGMDHLIARTREDVQYIRRILDQIKG
ncbi:TIM barrel protein [Candidatus Poribacteria bacterium]|nr:TIM barrel protein [Candidatus Poribacteria bacterium]